MTELSADYTAIRSRTDELSKLYEKLSLEVADIAKYTADLDIFWDGEANDAYNLKLGKDITDIGKIVVKIGNSVKAAGYALSMYMDNEKRISDIVSAYVNKKA